MKEPMELQPGQAVTCGQTIGAIGSSGNALNPHLHLEVRAGPSRASFSSMAHYDNSASAEEMANYCAWRVSGIFQLIDPLRLLSAAP
jgi:murein DD-endopeptidase MepM/ murein hydrolase activator NlpD